MVNKPIRAYSWFFTKVYKAYVDISHIVSHTILAGDDAQKKSQSA